LKKKKKPKRKIISNKLDKVWAEAVKQKADFQCEYCGKVKPLNSHHFYSRSIRSVRWDVDNGFCLCVGCHVFSSKFSAHKTPAEFVEWAIEKRGQEWYDIVKNKKNTIKKFAIFELEELLEKIKNAK